MGKPMINKPLSLFCFQSLGIFVAPVLSSASPQEFMVTAKLFVNGQLVSAPRITTISGESSTVSQRSEDNQDRIAFDVTAFDYKFPDKRGEEGILMDIEFEYKAGLKLIKTSQQVIAEPGAEVALPVADDDSVQLKLSAVRL